MLLLHASVVQPGRVIKLTRLAVFALAGFYVKLAVDGVWTHREVLRREVPIVVVVSLLFSVLLLLVVVVFDDDFDSFFIFWSLASFFKSFQDSLPSWSCSSSPKYLRKIWSLTMGVDFRKLVDG